MAASFPTCSNLSGSAPKEAKNRIMRVATTANLADRNRVGERLLEFYRTLAKGGVGSIVTEALRVSAAGGLWPWRAWSSTIAARNRGTAPALPTCATPRGRC